MLVRAKISKRSEESQKCEKLLIHFEKKRFVLDGADADTN